jgi:hypothetical protein
VIGVSAIAVLPAVTPLAFASGAPPTGATSEPTAADMLTVSVSGGIESARYALA